MEFDILDKIEEFRTIRSELVYLIEEFPADKVEETLFDGLTIKQLMLHIVLSEMFTIAVLEDFKEGREIFFEDPYEEHEDIVHPDSDWDDLFEDLSVAGERLLETLELFPTNLWDKIIWPKKNLTPVRLVEIDLVHYKDIYLEQIKQHIEF